MSLAGNNKRVAAELAELQKEIKNKCRAIVSLEIIKTKDKTVEWDIVMRGPDETCYKDGLFKLNIVIPTKFPFSPPIMKFKTKVFHPNVNDAGEICVDILKYNWSAALSIYKTILSISALLGTPNPDDPLDSNAAHLYKTNKAEYKKIVLEYIQKYGYTDNKLAIPKTAVKDKAIDPSYLD